MWPFKRKIHMGMEIAINVYPNGYKDKWGRWHLCDEQSRSKNVTLRPAQVTCKECKKALKGLEVKEDDYKETFLF